MTTNSNAGRSPVDRRARPLIPRGEPWVRHGCGLDEWWGLLGYTCTKDRRTGEWVLKYRGDELGRYDFLSVTMRAVELGGFLRENMMDARTGYSVLIKAAAALANQQFMPGADRDDYPHQTMTTRKVARMMERPRDNLRGIAVNVREGADAQASEIAKLRAAIQQTLEENGHLADGDNCTLIHLVRAIETPNGEETWTRR